MTPLADLTDLQVVMGVDAPALDDARAEQLLATASEAVAAVTGRCYTLAPGEAATVTAFPQGGRVRLPLQPVLSVTSVTGADGATVTGWTLDGVTVTGLCAGEVTIAYQAGVTVVPDLEVGIVCQMVMRALSVDTSNAAMTGESIDGYSYQMGASGASGAVGMLPAELASLRAARPRIAQPISML